jgi:hypothetical protein
MQDPNAPVLYSMYNSYLVHIAKSHPDGILKRRFDGSFWVCFKALPAFLVLFAVFSVPQE